MQDKDWKTADFIARGLADRDCDPNEVAKAFVYLRTHKDADRFFRFLRVLAERGGALVRSRRTLGYYKTMLELCRPLEAYRTEPGLMCEVLGWTVRLMRFHMAAKRG
jgi:hypothetical protein